MQILPKKMYSEKFYEKLFTVNNAKNAKLRKDDVITCNHFWWVLNYWLLNLKQLKSWKSVFLFINSTNWAWCVICFDSLKLTTSRRHVQVNEFCEFLGWSNDHSWNWTIIDELWLCSSCAVDFILRSRWPEGVFGRDERNEWIPGRIQPSNATSQGMFTVGKGASGLTFVYLLPRVYGLVSGGAHGEGGNKT